MGRRTTISAKEAAVAVLLDAGEPLHIRDLAGRVLANHRTGLKGKTPEATIAAHLHVASKKGDTFKKVGRGTFDLIDREAAAAASRKRAKAASSPKRATARRSRPAAQREPVAA